MSDLFDKDRVMVSAIGDGFFNMSLIILFLAIVAGAVYHWEQNNNLSRKRQKNTLYLLQLSETLEPPALIIGDYSNIHGRIWSGEWLSEKSKSELELLKKEEEASPANHLLVDQMIGVPVSIGILVAGYLL